MVRLLQQRLWYVLSPLWDGAYKRTLAANRSDNVVTSAYVQRQTTENKMCYSFLPPSKIQNIIIVVVICLFVCLITHGRCNSVYSHVRLTFIYILRYPVTILLL